MNRKEELELTVSQFRADADEGGSEFIPLDDFVSSLGDRFPWMHSPAYAVQLVILRAQLILVSPAGPQEGLTVARGWVGGVEWAWERPPYPSSVVLGYLGDSGVYQWDEGSAEPVAPAGSLWLMTPSGYVSHLRLAAVKIVQARNARVSG